MAALPRNILILMSRTGGGHLASARALEAEFLRQDPQARVTIVDLLTDHISFPFSRLPRTYDTLVNRAPRLWQAMWKVTARRAVGGSSSALVRYMSQSKLERLIRDCKPDLVVSVHPLVNDLMIPVLARLAPATRYVTVVTDLGGIHPLWLHPGNAAIYLPTAKAVAVALARGLPQHRLHTHGLPIRAEFALAPPARADARLSFGLDPALPVVLVMGGGGGIGPIEAIVEAMAAALATTGGRATAQIAVITAKNDRLRARLAGRSWPVLVVPLGFVDRMSDLMHASDLLVTKAGPGSIAEASVRGLPMLIYGFIPGQEAANVDHVVEAGAGLFEPDPKALAGQAAALLGSDGQRLAGMAAKARGLGRDQATRDIVASILADLPKA
ncbi:MGDG synthase family glycosyltransferase [Phreatobacter stygius]|uniref:Galactosyldiacylglycerol synthase n=1 Tax=Phreatobacter stygius TaxID=1940610 RepID=A0A4D7B0U4_9HYPH|nr:glycosyltransferase [Phreatobacter stygius]QCI63066.1 hypothetical protein E8M01_01700 [Phreatobacter stygius]